MIVVEDASDDRALSYPSQATASSRPENARAKRNVPVGLAQGMSSFHTVDVAIDTTRFSKSTALSSTRPRLLSLVVKAKQRDADPEQIVDEILAELGLPTKQLPEAAPELWAERDKNTRERIDAFVRRVYGEFIASAGMKQADLKRLDPKAYASLHRWCSATGNKPGDIIPSSHQTADTLEEIANSDPDSLRRNEARRRLASRSRAHVLR